ncbi:MAG: helix-turn-helix transcriptional regulator [Lachnospiraceae bacterium]|nr:helix-turn-helix transcriptional regulator [Lachnospiraceae bacterium]
MRKGLVESMMNYGHIRLNLSDLIEKSNLSKNKICQLCQIQHTQLNRYCKNEATRIDLNVLARICCVLECDISDILTYVNEDGEEVDKNRGDVK